MDKSPKRAGKPKFKCRAVSYEYGGPLNGLNPVSRWSFLLIAALLNPAAIVNKAAESEVLQMKMPQEKKHSFSDTGNKSNPEKN